VLGAWFVGGGGGGAVELNKNSLWGLPPAFTT